MTEMEQKRVNHKGKPSKTGSFVGFAAKKRRLFLGLLHSKKRGSTVYYYCSDHLLHRFLSFALLIWLVDNQYESPHNSILSLKDKFFLTRPTFFAAKNATFNIYFAKFEKTHYKSIL